MTVVDQFGPASLSAIKDVGFEVADILNSIEHYKCPKLAKRYSWVEGLDTQAQRSIDSRCQSIRAVS